MKFMHFIESTAASQFTKTLQARLQLHFQVYQTSFTKMKTIITPTHIYMNEQNTNKILQRDKVSTATITLPHLPIST